MLSCSAIDKVLLELELEWDNRCTEGPVVSVSVELLLALAGDAVNVADALLILGVGLGGCAWGLRA